jgi:hypothetical protein
VSSALRRWRRLIAFSLAPMVAVALIAAGASTASAASGGGCDHPKSIGYGTIKGCINYANPWINPDAWATWSAQAGAGCYVRIRLYKEGQSSPVSTTTDACYKSHYYGQAEIEVLGSFITEASIIDDYTHVDSWSPWQHIP